MWVGHAQELKELEPETDHGDAPATALQLEERPGLAPETGAARGLCPRGEQQR